MLADMSASPSSDPHPAPKRHLELAKLLGFYSVVAIVIGQVIGSGIFFKPQVVAVFVLRARRPHAERPYRTWGYPVVPLIFLAFYTFLLITMLWENPGHRLVGLGLISIGAVVYFACANRTPHQSVARTFPGQRDS